MTDFNRYRAEIGAHYSVSPLAKAFKYMSVRPDPNPYRDGYIELGLYPILEGTDKALVVGALDQWGIPASMNGIGRTVNEVYAESNPRVDSLDYTSIIMQSANNAQNRLRYHQARSLIEILKTAGSFVDLMPTVKIVGVEETLFKATRTRR